MKVVHVVEPFAAGVATFIRYLVQRMPYDKHVIIHGERPEYNTACEIKTSFPQQNVNFLPWKGVRRQLSIVQDFRSLISLYRILKRIKDVDVVHLHSSKAGFLGRIVCTILGFKNVIYTPNGLSFMMDNHNWAKRKLYLFLELFSKMLYGRLIATSVSEKHKLKRYGLKAESIFNGTDIQIAIQQENEKRMHKKNNFKVITSGRIEFQKGTNWFNEIAKAFEDNTEIEFVWIGDGPERHLLTSKNITVKGWMSSEEVFKTLQYADIYLSTSRWEGLPFSVLEAMSFGKTLLLRKCVGNQDLVSEGRNGHLFSNTEEAIKHLKHFYAQPFLNEYLGSQSRLMCQKYYNADMTALSYRKEYLKYKGAKALNELDMNPLAFGEKRYFTPLKKV